nr:hypothetical protein [Pseudomonas lundensis]
MNLLSTLEHPDALATLLQGLVCTSPAVPRLSDAGLLKVFRLICLSRRLIEWLSDMRACLPTQ